MSGFFSSPDESGYSTAASDYDRLSGENPGAFETGGLGRLFDRLFAGKPKSTITSSPLPDISPNTSQAAAASRSGPQPSISSAPSLLQRILKTAGGPPTHTPQGDPLVPGTGMTTPQFMEAITKAFQQSMPQFQIPGMGQPSPGQGSEVFINPAAPPQGRPPQAPQSGGNMLDHIFGANRGQQPFGPPAPIGGNRFGGNTYGGNTYGGNRFGGNTYGGNRYGASAMPQETPAGAAPIRMPGSLKLPPLPPRDEQLADEPQGFFSGGALHLRRGGYPANLISGMPTRYASGDYVAPDGRGDGRSDHVPARLSPGEYVMDAETVSMLGNGDNEAGARKLDGMRRNLRSHKGRALAKGKFSPDAKSPDAYLRGKE